MPLFTHYTLRTSNIDAARTFYDTVLGPGRADIVQLHEEAAKRGAPPHWLGSVTVDDVEDTASALARAGATRLGPTVSAHGRSFAVIRDPGGAILGLSSARLVPRVEVAWHLLHSRDVEASARAYNEVFGWALTDSIDMADAGVYRNFAWSTGEPNVGSMGAIAGRPGLHPHWLFAMRVKDLEHAIANARRLGASFVGVWPTSEGERIAVGDDPLGAAFALRGA